MEEVEHVIAVLKSVKQALQNEDVLKLKDLSNQTIHSASTSQDEGSITIAVLVYTLSKLLERKEYMKIKNWNNFLKKFNSFLDLAILSLKSQKPENYVYDLEKARKAITSISINLKPYIEEVIRKASINKASKIYEHGISMEQTARLLGITQWELSEYSGQTNVSDVNYNKTLDVKKRAKMALEFFS